MDTKVSSDVKVFIKLKQLPIFGFGPNYRYVSKCDKSYDIMRCLDYKMAFSDIEQNLARQSAKFSILSKKYKHYGYYNGLEFKEYIKAQNVMNKKYFVDMYIRDNVGFPYLQFPDYVYEIDMSKLILPFDCLNYNLKSLKLDCRDDWYSLSLLNELPINLEKLYLSICFTNSIDGYITNFIEFLPIGLKNLQIELVLAPKICYVDINRLPPNLEYLGIKFSSVCLCLTRDTDNDDDLFPIKIAPIHTVYTNVRYNITNDDKYGRFTSLDVDIADMHISSKNPKRISAILNNITNLASDIV